MYHTKQNLVFSIERCHALASFLSFFHYFNFLLFFDEAIFSLASFCVKMLRFCQFIFIPRIRNQPKIKLLSSGNQLLIRLVVICFSLLFRSTVRTMRISSQVMRKMKKNCQPVVRIKISVIIFRWATNQNGNQQPNE